MKMAKVVIVLLEIALIHKMKNITRKCSVQCIREKPWSFRADVVRKIVEYCTAYQLAHTNKHFYSNDSGLKARKSKNDGLFTDDGADDDVLFVRSGIIRLYFFIFYVFILYTLVYIADSLSSLCASSTKIPLNLVT